MVVDRRTEQWSATESAVQCERGEENASEQRDARDTGTEDRNARVYLCCPLL